MADFDVATYLAGKGFQGKQGNGPEILYPCFLDCGEDARSRKRKLSYNTDTDLYQCWVCGAHGGSYLLQVHFGDTPDKPTPGTDPDIRRRILDWAADTGSTMLLNNDPVLMHLLDERGLGFHTITEAKLGCVVPPWSLTGSLPEQFTRAELAGTGLVQTDGTHAGEDYFYNHLLIPYIQRGHVVGMRGRSFSDRGPKYLSGKGDHVRLFNIDSLDGADDVIITEGELDCLILHQHLKDADDDRAKRFAVVGLSGVNGFPEGADRYFTNIKRIYIGFDPDDAGDRAALALKEQLGPRARILQLPPQLPKADWGEYLLPIPPTATDEWRAQHPHAGHTWRDVMGLLGSAAGKRLFSIRDTGFAYRQELAENPNGIKTGFTKLDNFIKPGLLPGDVMVVLAKTGTGKTIFLNNIAWNARHVPILFLSLEMTKEQIYAYLHKLALFHNPRWTDTQVEEALSNIFICDENRMSERDVEGLIAEFAVETGGGPGLCLLDYLGYFARSARGNSSYEKTSSAVMALKAIAKKAHLPVITPAQVNRGAAEGKPIDIDDGRDSGVLEETADFLLSLWRPDKTLDPENENKALFETGLLHGLLLKSRRGGAGQRFNLQGDWLTLAIVDEQGRDAGTAKHHNKLLGQGTTYEELRRMQLAPVQDTFFGRKTSV